MLSRFVVHVADCRVDTSLSQRAIMRPPSQLAVLPYELLTRKQKTGWPLSSHYQIPRLFNTFQVNIYEVSTLATVAIQNEMHVISHCNNLSHCVLQ